jgi:hypothetical protein
LTGGLPTGKAGGREVPVGGVCPADALVWGPGVGAAGCPLLSVLGWTSWTLSLAGEVSGGVRGLGSGALRFRGPEDVGARLVNAWATVQGCVQRVSLIPFDVASRSSVPTKGAKGARARLPARFAPFVLPSGPC